MSIFTAADHPDMSLQWDDDVRPHEDADVAMRLMAEGIPLQLLVDIALPMTLVRDLFDRTDRAVPS